MKNLLILVAFVLCACGSQAHSSESAIPTPETSTATTLPKFIDVVMQMNESSFIKNVGILINEISHRNSEAGFHLSQCDLVISKGPDSLRGVYFSGNNDCAIALIREEDLLIPDSLWSEYAPKPNNGSFVVAATTTMNGNDYPIVVIPESEFNSEYYLRVLAHEGFHLNRIKSGTDCADYSNSQCFVNEEVLAYQIQFALLENYLKKQDLFDGYKYASPESYSPKGISEQNIRALEMEHELYFQNKDGKLPQFLEEIGYGN